MKLEKQGRKTTGLSQHQLGSQSKLDIVSVYCDGWVCTIMIYIITEPASSYDSKS